MESVQHLCFGEFHLDPDNQCLWKGRQRVILAPTAFAVLSYLVNHADRLVTKDELMQAIWPDVFVCDAVLKVRISEIRHTLGDSVRQPRYIETLHRRGYRFIEAVTPWQPVPLIDNSHANEVLMESRLVGRNKVLAELDAQLQNVLRGERRTVFVTGETGIGKTAVVDTFLQRVMSLPDVLIASGQCVEHHGTAEAYLPVLNAVSRLCRGDSAARLVALLLRYAPNWLMQLPGLVGDSQRMSLQHELLGTTPARLLHEMCELCEVLTRESVLVLVLEDLHWSDYATLDLLSSLASQRAPCRLLLVGTYRPIELILRDHPLRSVKQELELHQRCTDIQLEFLQQKDVDAFLLRRYPGHDFPCEFVRVIHRRSGGNPLFMVSILQYLLARQCLVEHAGHWRLNVSLDEIRESLPESLQTMIEHQLLRLDTTQLEALTRASIAGTEFTASAITSDRMSDSSQVEALCAGLAKNRLFIRSLGPAELPSGAVTERYVFVHALYQDVLVKRLSTSQRACLHCEIGVRKEIDHAGKRSRVAVELARHFELGRDNSRAIDYLRQAADNARSRHANRSALDYTRRAIQLLGNVFDDGYNETRLQLLFDEGALLQIMADMPAAAAIYTNLADLCRKLDLFEHEMSALLHLATVTSWLDRDRCLSVVEQIRSRCDGMQKQPLRSTASGWCAYWNFLWRGWREADAQACENAVDVARHPVQLQNLIPLLGRFSYIQSLRTDYACADLTAAEGMQLALETGDASTYLLTLYFRCWALLHRGDWGTLYRVLHDEGLPLAEKNGHALWQLLFQLQLSWLAEQAFSFDVARDLSASGLRQAELSALPYGCLLGNIRLGFAELGAGNHHQALDRFNDSTGLMAQERVLMDWILAIPLHHGLSICALAHGDHELARDKATVLCTLAAEPGERTYMALGHNTLAQIALSEDDLRLADRELKCALDLLKQVDAPLAAWRVHASVAILSERQDKQQTARRHWMASAVVIQRLASSLSQVPDFCQSLLSAPSVQAALNRKSQSKST